MATQSFFNSDEANASNIVRAERQEKDGVHQYWVFGVEDEDGNYCDWKDTTLGASASYAEQRTAIHTHLTTACYKIPAQPVILLEESAVIGTTVGATAP